jgi:hypothetical protein
VSKPPAGDKSTNAEWSAHIDDLKKMERILSGICHRAHRARPSLHSLCLVRPRRGLLRFRIGFGLGTIRQAHQPRQGHSHRGRETQGKMPVLV